MSMAITTTESGVLGAVGVMIQRLATEWVSEARSIVPVDSGDLRDSIMVVSTSPSEGIVEAGKEYASEVEFGTSKTAANPYMRRSRLIAVLKMSRGL